MYTTEVIQRKQAHSQLQHTIVNHQLVCLKMLTISAYTQLISYYHCVEFMSEAVWLSVDPYMRYDHETVTNIIISCDHAGVYI